MARRTLTSRTMMRSLSSLEGKRLVVARALTADAGRLIEPGTDITEEAKDWPTLWTHVRRGSIIVIQETVEAVVAVASAVASPTPAHVAAAAKEVVDVGIAVGETVTDAISILRSINAAVPTDELRKTLEQAGAAVPEGASRSELWKLRADLISRGPKE